MRADRARTVLVAGGTRGIGRAIGLAFARTGARIVLTHRWGSVDLDELAAVFTAELVEPPEVVQADVANPADTRMLLEHIGAGGVDVFVANVCVVGRGTGAIAERDLRRSLEYSAWPLLRYLDAMADAFGARPSYVIATSSDGPDRFYPGYDYVAAAKAALEALTVRLAAQHEGMRANVLRARQVDTTGYREMFGPEARDVVARFSRFDVGADEVANVAVALCSGDLDGLSGQVVTVDRGAGPIDNLVNVAPTLLGGTAAWAASAPNAAQPMTRSADVLWVDAGVQPGDIDLCRPVHVVSEGEAGQLDADRIPDCVVVGCDWRTRDDADPGTATLLPTLMDRAARHGGAPRYGIRVERAVEPPAPGEALGRALDLYWGSWRVATESRLNTVRYTDDRFHTQAVAVARSLLSGALDGMRGQVLCVTRGAR